MQTNCLLGNRYRSFYGTSLQCDSMPLHLHTITLLIHLIIQTFALSMVFSSFPHHYRHRSSLLFLCLQQNILYLLRYQMLPSCEANAAGRTEMVKWLGSWSCSWNLLLLCWCQQKGWGAAPSPCRTPGTPGSTGTGAAGVAGTAGMAAVAQDL